MRHHQLALHLFAVIVVFETVKLISYMDEKEEKEACYLMKLCRWHEANLTFKKLILKR